ncbi:response regulator [Chitinimonas arctica]|uniref:Response regulator n=1 Tax=Chitinimonas arctica TaxID=2594795 RepID=A0A516S9S1_9NEIS|nr:response regulator [Chitinimonas arctica]QDQ24895.1 response regulator [Chitinimonas arctica]
MHYIMLVDDEQNLLNALSRELARVEDEQGQPIALAVDCYPDPASALMAAEIKSYDLVISDYRMPGMNGVEFLSQFRRHQPDAIRIILSGSTDVPGLIRAVNEAQIFHLLRKPWCEEELKQLILRGIRERQRLLENKRLADVVRAGQSAVRHR